MEIIYKENKKELAEITEEREVEGVLLSQLEAQTYLKKSKRSRWLIGFGVWLIMTGVSAVLFFNQYGLIIMFSAIAVAVIMIIFSGFKMEIYENIEELPIRLDQETYQSVEDQSARLQLRNTLGIAIGIGLILIAVGALVTFNLNPGFLLFTIGFSVFLIITSSSSQDTYDHLLSKGDYEEFNTYTPAPKAIETTTQPVHAETDNAELNAIIKAGSKFIDELCIVKKSISNPSVVTDIDEIIELTNKIMYKLQQEPELISSAQRFFNYYLPMTAKLVVNYVEVKKQDISGTSVESIATKIEKTLSTLTIAYKSQLEKLYQHTSVDLETDISALETILKNDGLLADEGWSLENYDYDEQQLP